MSVGDDDSAAAFRRQGRQDHQGLDALLAVRKQAARRRTQHSHRPVRRRRLLGLRLLRLADRHAGHRCHRRARPALHRLPHDGDVLDHARRAAHRAAITTPSAWAASPISTAAIRAIAARSRARPEPLPRCCARTAIATTWSASGTSRPCSRPGRRGRSTAGRWRAASTGTTASWMRRPTSTRRNSCSTTRTSIRPAPLRPATTSRPISSTSRSASSPITSPAPRRRPGSPGSRSAPAMRRTRRPAT